MPSLLQIEKWYLDCVTADGGGMIGYAARLRAGPLGVRCSEVLSWPAEGAPVRSRTVSGGPPPVPAGGGVAWHSAALRLDGRWERRDPEIAATTLHAEAAGSVQWSCLCPSAATVVTVDGGEHVGSGYVERLVMTLPPGRLPMRELRWGRFISGGQNCVWIAWANGAERFWCFHNGQAVAGAMPDPQRLTWGGHALELEAGTTLRAGQIADTVLAQARALRWLLPRRLRRLEEIKWCSRGVLTDAAGRRHAGWAIHEVVLFP